MIAAFGEILFDVYPNEEHLGGAPFNFIYHTHMLTGEGSLISRIGNDKYGKRIQNFLSENKIHQRFLQIDEKKPTGTATVRLDSAGNPTFIIEENAAYDFIEMPLNFSEEIEILYFGTLAQRSAVSRNTLQQLCRKAKRCFLDVNLRQHYYTADILHQSFEFADIVKLNIEELQTIHPLFFAEPFDLRKSAQSFARKFSLTHLAVTLGGEGSWMFTENGADFHRTRTENIIDTVGAGDGFSAIMCLGILRGWPLKKIHETASQFAAKLCSINGALPEDDRFYISFV